MTAKVFVLPTLPPAYRRPPTASNRPPWVRTPRLGELVSAAETLAWRREAGASERALTEALLGAAHFGEWGSRSLMMWTRSGAFASGEKQSPAEITASAGPLVGASLPVPVRRVVRSL